MDIEGGLFTDLVVIFAVAAGGGLAARLLRLPALLGYIALGILIGPDVWKTCQSTRACGGSRRAANTLRHRRRSISRRGIANKWPGSKRPGMVAEDTRSDSGTEAASPRSLPFRGRLDC